MFGAMEADQEQYRTRPKKDGVKSSWEMRDIIALMVLQKLQEFHGTREEAVQQAEPDAIAAYNIANTQLRVRSQLKTAYYKTRRTDPGQQAGAL